MTKEFKRTVELDSDHEIGGFDCGVPELDAWLRDLALRNQKKTPHALLCLPMVKTLWPSTV